LASAVDCAALSKLFYYLNFIFQAVDEERLRERDESVRQTKVNHLTYLLVVNEYYFI
jgi:hypothetical protein